MKTPKRYQNKPIPTMPEDSEPDWYVLNEWCQRAKRKNREAQLKRTISRLTYELAENTLKNELATALIKYAVKSSRQVTITGTHSPHYYCLTEITATHNSTTANTY